MLGHTHALFGAATLLATETLARTAGISLVQPHVIKGLPAGLVLCTGAAILGALAPDLDAEESSIKGELGLAGELIQGGLSLLGVKHRGVFHSGLAILVVFVAAGGMGWWLGYADVGLAFGLGYFSHIALADAMTITGVPLFWPLKHPFHLLPKGLRVRTGGSVEGLIFLLVIVGVIGLLWLRPDLIPPAYLRWLRQLL
jgi:membrane-bound metal-dependent hydrolase YbcI (DUF457 family)